MNKGKLAIIGVDGQKMLNKSGKEGRHFLFDLSLIINLGGLFE